MGCVLCKENWRRYNGIALYITVGVIAADVMPMEKSQRINSYGTHLVLTEKSSFSSETSV